MMVNKFVPVFQQLGDLELARSKSYSAQGGSPPVSRELQQVLGHSRWENIVVADGHAMESCKTLGISIDDHFREVTKMTFQRTSSIETMPLSLKSTSFLERAMRVLTN